MADQTQGAIDALLGLLTRAIGDEARLLGGLPGNMQFIKDEMDSMNGFLMHLTKTESEHDDQIRAWMKQVREIAYLAEDCVERYVRDIAPHDGGGILDTLVFLVCHPNKYWLRHRLAKQILELKARVNDVGERRNRYGVKVPPGSELKKAEDRAAAAEEEKRDAFRRALEQGIAECSRQSSQQDQAPGVMVVYSSIRTAVRRLLPAAVPSFITKAIAQLPAHVRSQGAAVVRGTWKKCHIPAANDEATFRCIEMLLCALYAYPFKGNNLELKRLSRKLSQEDEEAAGADEIKKQAMIFCYSLLSTNQKSCLQYLTAFQEETAISRTSLVRRWVAEGLVSNEPGRTLQEAGERYFSDLLFRGFIRRARIGDAGTVKSCEPLSGPISEFISSIAKADNFVVELPVHLDRQLQIRKIVKQPRPTHQAAAADYYHRCWSCCRKQDAEAVVDPMDDLAKFLTKLPALYRLNVLDLGGCKGLKPSHIATICTVVWLKYLCLRKTDVRRLPPRHMEKLKLLETLDIRETPRIHPRDVRRMYLQSLKHLLAGRYINKLTGEDAPTARTAADVFVVTAKIPARIAAMRNMETLSHVQVSDELLGGVAKLHRLKKLGVVIHQANNPTAQQLLAVVCKLAGSLRSLSIWITQAGFLDISVLQEATPSLILENLDINGRISSSLPSWVEMAGKLANISLRDTEMNGGETLRRLANVQSLRCLKLRRRSFIEQALIFRDVHFRALRFLIVDGDTITSVAFVADAAPKLEKIVWAISKVHSGELISGIDKLPKLEEIEIRGNFNVNSLLQAIGPRTEPPASTIRYRCRYVYLSDFNEITVVSKTKSDTATTLSLPAGVINQQQ
ncbi:unnamed protein product [Urochloa decumbens]|uniref:Rx N-terminal domain-containing protein n=1 Tax=Urochloa decumbens TaxID=240449 RepID=A0ABC9GSL8_9POAL